jgi:hypothetical protein
MLKTLEQIKTELEDKQCGNLITDIIEFIKQQKNIGIEASHKRNKENQNLRKFKKAIKEIGYIDGEDLDRFVYTIRLQIQNNPISNLTEAINCLSNNLTTLSNIERRTK